MGWHMRGVVFERAFRKFPLRAFSRGDLTGLYPFQMAVVRTSTDSARIAVFRSGRT